MAMAPSLSLPLLVLFLLFLPLSSPSPRVPAVIVFGDSTVDSGNNDYLLTILKADFPPYGCDFPGSRPTGRFCNGRLVTDLVSEALGLPPAVPAYLDPARSIQDFATGVCFASAGTGLDLTTSQEFVMMKRSIDLGAELSPTGLHGHFTNPKVWLQDVIPIMLEVELFKEYKANLTRYLGEENASYIVGEAVYIVSIGTNDFIENYFSTVTDQRRKQFTVDGFGDFLVGIAGEFLREIYLLGARKISFTGLTPFGCLPAVRTANLLNAGECVEEFNEAAREFNAKLLGLVEGADASLPGIKLRYAGVYDFVLHAIDNPHLYGFENTAEGCCGTGGFEVGFLCNKWNSYTCQDPDKHMFWDAIHPSQKFNYLLASFLLNTTLAEFL